MKLRKREVAFYAILVFSVLVIAVLAFAAWNIGKTNQEQIIAEEKGKNYKYHYMLIQTGFADEISGDLYAGAKEAGEDLDILVEDARETGSKDQTSEEMMKTAIAAKVDGIILESEDSSEIQKLINQASEQNIPVATVGRDSVGSKRKCFIGMDIKQTGKMFGHRIQKLYRGTSLDVVVLAEPDKASSSNSVYSYLKQEINNKDIHVRPVEVSGEYAFSADENIRKLFLEEEQVPDVVVCLNEVDTICAYKAAVDYNMVGKIQIIGYSAQEEVLSAIKKEIINSSIVVDLKEMGRKAVYTLYKNRDKKQGNAHALVAPQVVEKGNVSQYRKGKDEK